MKRLFEIVAESAEKAKELNKLRKEFRDKEALLLQDIAELNRLSDIADNGLDVIRIQLAESVLEVRGNIYGRTDKGGTPIAEHAIIAIAEGSNYLRKNYFGNKTYGGYYQGSNHPYGYGPKHGGICDEIGLKHEARKRDLTDDEKDACIYYLRNYVSIQKTKTTT